jgi:N-acetylmuramoyl-L-alanine amidase
MKIVIDPGHTIGDANKGQNGYYEHLGMWKLSNYLKDILSATGASVMLTRTANTDPSLSVRGGMAKGADLFIAQHSNGFNGLVRGVEVFYSVKRPSDRKIAAALSEAISLVMDSPNRGAKVRDDGNGRDYYGQMRAAEATGVPHLFLVESGFHDHPLDEAFLLDDANLKKIAQAQAEVIADVFNLKLTPVKKSPEEQTIERALANGVITDGSYWLSVVRGASQVSAGNVKALLDKANARLEEAKKM